MKPFLSLFFFLTLANITTQLTFDLGTPSQSQQPKQRQLQEFATYLPKIVDKVESFIPKPEIAKAAAPGESAKDGQTYTTTLKSNASISYSAVTRGDVNSGVKIEFKNEIESGVLELENVDVDAESAFIKEKYVDKFLKDSGQIIPDDKVAAEVKAAIEANGNFAVAEEAGLYKLTDKNEKDASKQLSFIVKLNPGAGGKTPEVEIHSSYFTSSFLVNIKTKTYIQGELNKTLNNALSHAKRMQRFNTSNRDQITHKFECSNAGTAFTEICKGANVGGDDVVKGTCALKEDKVEFKCEQDGDFLKVTAGFASGADEVPLDSEEAKPNLFHQGFVTQSLYDLTPVAESFFEEVVEYARRALGHLEPSEQTKIFED